tara:strand:+ start:759 stop:1481 length:723 start_codon:yes stop_codon:yes gene_type:complete
MYPALIFHSFNNNPNSDRFYDLKIENFISLIDFISQKIKPTKITLTFDDGFKSIIPAVEYSLRKGFKTIAYIISDYIDKDGFLTKKDIKYLYSIGCIIGSHSKSHRDLSKIGKDILKNELLESKRVLEKIIGEEVNHFSFPYGAYNKYAIRKAKTIYKFNAISRPNFFKQKNIIGRISINSLNCHSHNNIWILLRKKISYKYLIRLCISYILKTFLPNKVYLFLKNTITKKKSKDVFKGK